MARIYFTKKTRKEWRCHAGHVIPVGSSVHYAAPGFRSREIYACSQHPFKQSDLMTGLRQGPQIALETLEETLGTLDLDGQEGTLEALREALDEFASALGEYVDQRQESLDAWENGNSQLEELKDIAEQAYDEAQSLSQDVEDFDEEEPPERHVRKHAAWEEAYREHIQEQIDNALDAAQSIEF